MTTTIEQQYRQLLRWYPRTWRAHNGEALLGTLLDVATDQHRTALTPRERLAVRALGLRVHLDRLIHPRLRELAATIALTTGTGIAIGVVIISSWAPGGPADFDPALTRVGGFYDLSPATAIPWLAATAAALLGRWNTGRCALLLSIPLDLALPHIADALHALSTDRTTLLLLAAAAALAALGAPERHWALTPATTGWVMLTLAGYATQTPRRDLSWQPSNALWGNIAVIWYAAAGLLVVTAGLAIAHRWLPAATLILALTPLALTFSLSLVRSELHENGSAIAITAPVAVGLILITLVSSGRLRSAQAPTSLR